jgi:hypothetical protein
VNRLTRDRAPLKKNRGRLAGRNVFGYRSTTAGLRVAEQNPKAASVKAERIVDMSWLKKLEDEGFFEKVYKHK